MLPTPTAVVQRFLDDVLSGGRPESSHELVDSEPLRQRVEALRSAFADLSVDITQVVAIGRRVAVHLGATGTHTGPFLGARPTGRRWTSSATAIFEVHRGRIVDFWITWDTLAIAEQLGVVGRAEDASA